MVLVDQPSITAVQLKALFRDQPTRKLDVPENPSEWAFNLDEEMGEE
jgi:hypothetical protein